MRRKSKLVVVFGVKEGEGWDGGSRGGLRVLIPEGGTCLPRSRSFAGLSLSFFFFFFFSLEFDYCFSQLRPGIFHTVFKVRF